MATKKSAKTAKKTKSATKATVKSDSTSESFDDLAEAKVNQPSKRGRTLAIVAAIVLLGLAAFLAYRFLILAWVDQTPINRLSYYKTLDQKYGKDLKDQLITEQLILNEAKKRKVNVSEQAVNDEIKKIEEQQGGSDQLKQILELQGLTVEELRKQINFQLLIKEMFGQGVDATDEEVDQYIQQNKEQFASVSAEIKTQVKESLRLQKISQSFNQWLTEAKAGNRIIRY